MTGRDQAAERGAAPDAREWPRLSFLACPVGHIAVNPDGFHWTILSDREREVLESGSACVEIPAGRRVEPALEKKLIRLRVLQTPSSSSGNATSESISRENAGAPLSVVVLHVTDRCNLHCSYCYAATSRAVTMSNAVARRAVDVLAATPARHRIRLEFHGGEPLLEWDLIRLVVGYASRFRLANSAFRFSFSVQTNGTLLDEAKVSFLKEHDIAVGISLDGPRSTNDAHRVYSDGRSSFDEAVRGLRLLKDAGVRHGVISVVTDATVLDSFLGFMVDCGFRHVTFAHLLRRQGRSQGQIAPASAGAFGAKMLDLADRVIAHNLATPDDRITVRNLSVLVLNILSKSRTFMCMRIPCGAGCSMIGIAPDGSVYPCKEMADEPELAVGHVLDSSVQELLSHPLCVRLRAQRSQFIGDCAGCYARDVCEVGCPSRSHHLGATFLLKTELCEYYRTVIPGILWRLHEGPNRVLQLV